MGFLRSNSIALLALFVALGGSAYAAAKIGSSDIKRNAVESRHIGKGQVRAPDVDPRAIGPKQLGALPRAELTANSSQSFTNASETVEFDSADASRGLDLLTNGDSVVVAEPGVYAISGELHWASNPNGARIAELRIDPAAGDSRTLGSDVRPADSATNTTNAIATTVELGPNEIVSLQANQHSGGSLSLSDFSGFSARMTVQYVSPLPRR